MKLLLTSNGLTSVKLVNEFKTLITKPLNKLKILMITTGPENKNDKERKIKIADYVLDFEKPLIKAGIPKDNFTILFMSEPFGVDLNNFDIIFVCGGNTFVYLYLIKKLGLDIKIKNFIKKGGLYIGVSAGSIIAGPDIKIASFGLNHDENIVKIKDLKGLELVNFTLFPHADKDDKKIMNNNIKKANLEYNCLILNDGEGVSVINNNIKEIK